MAVKVDRKKIYTGKDADGKPTYRLSDNWWLFIDHKGKRKAVAVGSKEAATRKKAEVEAALLLNKLDLDPPEESPKVSFKDYAEKFMSVHVASKLKYSTQEGYRSNLDLHILPEYGKYTLDEITRPMVKDYCARKLKDGLSAGTVGILVGIISSIYGEAIEDKIIAYNPTEKRGKYLKKRAKKKVEFLTWEEGEAFLAATKKHNPRLYPLILVALRTGMRQGEIIALQWGDIDWHGGFIEVSRTDYKGVVGTPKNDKSRKVDMSDGLASALKRYKATIAAEALAAGKKLEDEDLVFTTEDGKRYKAGNLRLRFYTCLRKAGLRKVPFHATRHSYASQLLKLGESLAYIRDQLGHSSIQITVDLYGHLVPGANRKAVNRLDPLGESAAPAQPGIVQPQFVGEISN